MRRRFRKLVNWLTQLIFPLAVFWWKITKPTTRGVKVVVENAAGELLLVKVTYIPNAAWVFPGGKVERNETSAKAAQREVLEETGVKLDRVVPIGEYFSDKYGKQDTVFVFYGRTVNSESLLINPYEILKAKWFKQNELPPLPENNAKALAMYRQ